MREIKFRGLNDYGWHVGHLLISYKDRAYIVTDMIDDDYANVKRSQEVELSTVGQYTGLKDKNGIEIFEGDIVEANSKGIKGTFEVKWRQEGSPCWILSPAWQSSQMWHLHAVETKKGYYKDNVNVIGNRYENPDLLEEANG